MQVEQPGSADEQPGASAHATSAQVTDEQPPPLHVTSQAHESLQSTALQELLPRQVTWHAPSPQLTLLHEFVPLQLTVHLASSLPQSIEPHVFGLAHWIVHDAASLQSTELQAPLELQAIVQAYPLGHATSLQVPSALQLMLQVRAGALHPPVHSAGQVGTTQYPTDVSQVRPPPSAAQSSSRSHAKSFALRSTRQLAAPITAATKPTTASALLTRCLRG